MQSKFPRSYQLLKNHKRWSVPSHLALGKCRLCTASSDPVCWKFAIKSVPGEYISNPIQVAKRARLARMNSNCWITKSNCEKVLREPLGKWVEWFYHDQYRQSHGICFREIVLGADWFAKPSRFERNLSTKFEIRNFALEIGFKSFPNGTHEGCGTGCIGNIPAEGRGWWPWFGSPFRCGTVWELGRSLLDFDVIFILVIYRSFRSNCSS